MIAKRGQDYVLKVSGVRPLVSSPLQDALKLRAGKVALCPSIIPRRRIGLYRQSSTQSGPRYQMEVNGHHHALAALSMGTESERSHRRSGRRDQVKIFHSFRESF
jgi:hypothetical protein